MLNVAMANSYADLYRQCVDIAKKSKKEISIPSYAWFLLQFRPASKTASNILHRLECRQALCKCCVYIMQIRRSLSVLTRNARYKLANQDSK